MIPHGGCFWALPATVICPSPLQLARHRDSPVLCPKLCASTFSPHLPAKHIAFKWKLSREVSQVALTDNSFVLFAGKTCSPASLLSVSGIVRVLSGSISLCQLCLGGNSRDLPSETPLKGEKSFICSQACLSLGLLWLPVALSSPGSASSWQWGQICVLHGMGSWPVSCSPSSPSSAREEHSLGLNHCLAGGQDLNLL